MANSEHLKDFKAVWGDSCQSMWAELLALSIAEAHLVTHYSSIQAEQLLTDLFYVPKLRGRLGDLTKDNYLKRVAVYRQSVITNRLVVLSASFETYFANFLESFLRTKAKYFNMSAGTVTDPGKKFFGEVSKVRGLGARIMKFGEIAPSKIKSIETRLSYLEDVYMLRNVLAHRAGLVDAHAASQFTHVKLKAGDRVSITTDELLILAEQVLRIAELLDTKL